MKSSLRCPIFFVAVFLSLLTEVKVASAFESGEIRLEIQGLVKTSESVLLSELQFISFDDESKDYSEEIGQRILKTGIFSKVDVQRPPGFPMSRYQVVVEEKWTTIPILKFSSGGGVTQTTLGVYDPNLFGQRIESGVQFEKIGAADSQVLWIKNPRILSSAYFLDLQYWNTQRVRLKYDQSLSSPKVFKAFLLKSRRGYYSIGKEFARDLKLRIFVEPQNDSFSDELISSSILSQVGIQVLPPSTQVLHTGFLLELGKTRVVEGVNLGTNLALNYRYSSVQVGPFRDFNTATASFTRNEYFFGENLYAQRIVVSSTSTDILQYWNYVGGLDGIRGFADNRFAGRHYWLSNSEWRRVMYGASFWTLQGVAFTDLLGISEDGRKLENIEAANIGLGLRVIVPKVYRLVLRFDYAQPVINSDEIKFGFGIQQFF